MTTPLVLDEGDSNLKEMEEEEEEDGEDWALPASTLPGQAAQYGPPLAVPLPSGHQICPGNKEVQSDHGRVSNIELNTNKAGMEGLDKEKINKIIMEASKGSRFYENQKKREQQTTERINKMMEKLAKLTESEKQAALKQVDEMVRDLELSRDLSRTIVHLDMDMFYAAVEMRDNPELRDKPMAVGGMGMLSTSNYKARRFGVRAAMPGFIAMKLCPELVLVPPHFDKYRAVSHQVREILAEYDPNFCPMSLDEAYFDLTDYLERRQMMSAEERTYPYCSAENCADGENEKKSSDEASGDKNIQESGGDEDGSSSPASDPHQEINGEDQPLFTSVSKEQGDTASASRTELSSPAKAPPTGQSESSFHHGDMADMKSLKGSTSEADQPEQDMQDNIDTGGTKRQDGKFETFGVTCEEVVREIRFRIEQKTMLTASAGIAPNCMLAKICSDKNKPNGQYRIPPTRADVMDFIRDLPIRKISGIGKVTERMLSALGIQTCTDLYHQRALCYLLFSQTSYSYFLRISLGLGSTHVERDGERKSISTERTFKEISVPSELYSKCNELCEALAEDIKEEQIQGKTVTVKLKTVNFEVKSRATSLKTPVSSAEEIFAVARDLIRTEIRACHPQPLRLRLMGVRLSSLQASKSSKSRQGTLLAMFAKKQNTNPKPNTTPTLTADCTEPTAHVQGESTLTNSVSASVNTLEEVSDASREEVSTADTKALTSPAGVGASVDFAEKVNDMSGIDVVAPGIEASASSAGVGASVNNLEGVEDVVPRIEVAMEDKESAPLPSVDVSVNTVDSTVSSDTELPSEQKLESANTEVDTRKTSATSNLHPSLHNWGDLEPRLPFCEDTSLSGTEENTSVADVDGEEYTEQIYHPELLSKSEIFNHENNQRVDKMLKNINSHAKCSECGSKGTCREPEEQKMLTCPICGQERAYSTLEAMNRHLDMCLNKSAIKELLHKDKPQSSSISQKPQSSSISQNQRRKSSPKKLQSRKRSLSGSISSKKKRSKSAPCKTLFDFFQKR